MKAKMISSVLWTCVLALVTFAMAGTAPRLVQEETELAKKAQNPLVVKSRPELEPGGVELKKIG